MSETGCKFCLDFSPCNLCRQLLRPAGREDFGRFCGVEARYVPSLRQFMADEVQDKHLHFGEGNYDLAHMVNDIVAEDAYVTMETGYKPPVDIKLIA